jgi:ROS/MUCR transcriptional regulator protein
MPGGCEVIITLPAFSAKWIPRSGPRKSGPTNSEKRSRLSIGRFLGSENWQQKRRLIGALPYRSGDPSILIMSFCLECCWRGQMLRRHLATGHEFTVEQYRARWYLTREHPRTDPSYSERRSSLTKQLGLGRDRRARRVETESAALQGPPTPQQRSRRRGGSRSG